LSIARVHGGFKQLPNIFKISDLGDVWLEI